MNFGIVSCVYVCVCVCARASGKYVESYDAEDRRNTLNIQLKYELFFLEVCITNFVKLCSAVPVCIYLHADRHTDWRV
jgi:hypothetical protein